MIEIWKCFKTIAASNQYHKKGTKFYVSNYGRVRINDKIVDTSAFDGYIKIAGNWVHRLVYQQFVGKIPKGYEIDHIDTNKQNNRVDNLRAVTKKENMNNPLTKKRLSKSHKGKATWNKGKRGMKSKRFVWMNNDGDIKILTKNIAAQHYSDYILIEQI